jgi:hypothetical protein
MPKVRRVVVVAGSRWRLRVVAAGHATHSVAGRHQPNAEGAGCPATGTLMAAS